MIFMRDIERVTQQEACHAPLAARDGHPALRPRARGSPPARPPQALRGGVKHALNLRVRSRDEEGDEGDDGDDDGSWTEPPGTGFSSVRVAVVDVLAVLVRVYERPVGVHVTVGPPRRAVVPVV